MYYLIIECSEESDVLEISVLLRAKLSDMDLYMTPVIDEEDELDLIESICENPQLVTAFSFSEVDQDD